MAYALPTDLNMSTARAMPLPPSDTDDVDTLTVPDILGMNVEGLRRELQTRGLMPVNTTKPDLQAALIHAITQPPTLTTTATGTSFLEALEQIGHSDASPTVHAGQSDSDPAVVEHPRDMMSSRLSGGPSGLHYPDPQLELRRMEMEERRMELEERRQARLQEQEERRQAREQEERREQRQYELELRRLEIQSQTIASATADDDQHPRTPPFRIDTAIKLIPRFNEHDIESFLLSFEKIAQLNSFPQDKYAAILQAHLTGKALKVFTELSVEDCQDYPTLKAALLTAYAVVPEVYRKRFRTINKHQSETDSYFRRHQHILW